MTYQLEVVILPVSDVDRSLAFYRDQAGFSVDVDYCPSDDFRVLQLTPAGSACSIQLQHGIGSARTHYLLVHDVEAARKELRGRGVDVGAVRHKSPADSWAGDFAAGPDPERRDYASFADFTDPDGHVWVLQERH